MWSKFLNEKTGRMRKHACVALHSSPLFFTRTRMGRRKEPEIHLRRSFRQVASHLLANDWPGDRQRKRSDAADAVAGATEAAATAACTSRKSHRPAWKTRLHPSRRRPTTADDGEQQQQRRRRRTRRPPGNARRAQFADYRESLAARWASDRGRGFAAPANCANADGGSDGDGNSVDGPADCATIRGSRFRPADGVAPVGFRWPIAATAGDATTRCDRNETNPNNRRCWASMRCSCCC